MRLFPLTLLRGRGDAFTLVEMLVSMAVLALLVVMIAQLFSSAVSLTTLGDKRIEADEQARILFDRMSVDFARMVKRADVDYFLKQPAYRQLKDSQANPTGNDQIAFYSEVPGYYPEVPNYDPATRAQSPVSLVAYRVNSNKRSGSYGKVERLGKGLVWNGVSAAYSPVLFLPVPLATPLSSPLPSPMPMAIPTPAWRQAGNSDADPDYELLGAQVFRLEYYYLLKGQTVPVPQGTSTSITTFPSILSDTPWDTRIPGHLAVAGLQDVAAIVVAIAVMDTKSRVLIKDPRVCSQYI